MGIAARSTNTKGFVHYGGDVVSGIEDGIGIIVGSASTGGTAYIEPISDSDTAALGIRAKGAAKLTLGNTSNTVEIVGNSTIVGNVVLGNGTSTGTKLAIKGIYNSTFSGQIANLTSGGFAEITLTTAVGVINPGDLFSLDITPTGSSQIAVMNVRLSTVATSVVTITVGNITSTALGATESLTGNITWIDLT